MQGYLNAMLEIAPDMFEVLELRYRILQKISLLAPIGRRTLAEELALSERKLRTETDFLRNQELIHSSRGGMVLTKKGMNILRQLAEIIHTFSGMSQTEQKLARHFGIERVVIVPGDLDKNDNVLATFGYVLSDWLEHDLTNTNLVDATVTVLGGTTLSGVAKNIRSFNHDTDVVFVSGRGGMGDLISAQANVVSADFASRVGGKHVSLHVPEKMSEATYKNLLTEPTVKNVLDLMATSSIAIHSIGQAMAMAKEREMTEEELKLLKAKKAVAEVFGTFYNQEGDVIYQIPRIGLQAKMLAHIPNIYAVAGGSSKAYAINAYLKHAPHQTWLLTDEGAANLVLKGLSL